MVFPARRDGYVIQRQLLRYLKRKLSSQCQSKIQPRTITLPRTMTAASYMLSSIERSMKQSRYASFGIVKLNQKIRHGGIALLLDGRPAYTFSYGPERAVSVSDLHRSHKGSVRINQWDYQVCGKPFNLITLKISLDVIRMTCNMVDVKKLRSGFETYDYNTKGATHYVHAVIVNWLLPLPAFDRSTYSAYMCMQGELYKLVVKKTWDRFGVIDDMVRNEGLGTLYWALLVLMAVAILGCAAQNIYYALPPGGVAELYSRFIEYLTPPVKINVQQPIENLPKCPVCRPPPRPLTCTPPR